MRQRKPFKQTLIDHVDTSGGPDACWPWTGAKKKGYGVAFQALVYGSNQARKRKTWYAHRAYLVFVARDRDVPEGSFVCHTCDNPPCCNPRHLVVADAAWNNADMHRKGRNVVVCGSRTGTAKTTEDRVAVVKKALASKMISRQEACDRLGLSESAVKRLCNGSAWKHVAPFGPFETVAASNRPSPYAKHLRRHIVKNGMAEVAKRLGVSMNALRTVAYPLNPGERYAFENESTER